MNTIIKNKLQFLLTVFYLGYVAWWFSFQSVVHDQGLSVQRFGYTYGILALAGSIIGFMVARKWGGFRTVLGKALMFFSIGLFAQEAGQLIFTYYNYVSHIQIPYPSWGDAAYFGSTISYICGGFFLAKAAGVRFSLKNRRYQVIAIAVPVALLLVSFFVFLHHHEYDWHKPLTVFLDLGYPIGDATYISLALIAFLLSAKMLGGMMRVGMLILMMALFVQYVSDFSFLYQSNRGTYLGGQWVDLLYMTSYFVLSSALAKFSVIYTDLRKKTGTTSAVSGVNQKEAV